jgi:hypothetical protein
MIDQKEMENVESFKYSGSLVTNIARWHDIKSRIGIAKAPFSWEKTLFTANST